MIKILLSGVWVCAVTLGAVYFSVHMALAPAVDEDAAKKAGLELTRGETITVPVLAEGKVAGYFLGRISFMMDKEKIKGLTLPLTEYMTDELFTLLVGNKMVDIANTDSFDLEAFRAHIKDDMNRRFGDTLVEEVLVEQLDYLAKDDTRTSGTGSEGVKPPVKIVEAAPVETSAAEPTH